MQGLKSYIMATAHKVADNAVFKNKRGQYVKFVPKAVDDYLRIHETLLSLTLWKFRI